ncbi:MAG: ATP-dependent metallopeptidase FtsH/Yme1/Tma family protein [Chloroflexi bacterium]|nr:MAG: ATP-dependent metallopeptidase FtsH/Yme1/Tma family protein [Chloroflexota bacterium]
MNSRMVRNGLLWMIVGVLAVLLLFNVFQPGDNRTNSVTLSRVVDEVKAGNVKTIIVQDNSLRVQLRNGQELFSRKEDGVSFTETMTNFGVTTAQLVAIDNITNDRPSQFTNWVAILSSFLPLVIFGGLLLFMLRQAQSGNNQALSFGRSRARLQTGDKPTVTFADVAGVDEAKQELQEVVEFLKEPAKFANLGARIPRGVLMVGPPGTGKTLMARAVAGEAGVPFFSISGSEFVEMFVGVGASRVRDLFDQAKRNAPCIVFVDEIDAVGRHRGAGLGGSHDEREQTLNQILVEMDGFDTDTNVIVIAATNRPDILDPALLRPGRFDRRVILDRPDSVGRRQILDVHVRGKPIAPDVDLTTIAKTTPGFTGADIENVINEAAILAARHNRKAIIQQDFQEAVEKVVAGPERKSRIISARERRIIAHHEAGHAIVSRMLPHADSVQKVSIVARGMALGYTLTLPENENFLQRKAKFESDLSVMLAGRAAEELVFEDVTTSASDDLDRATNLARSMVTQWGMSEKLGPQTFGDKEELVFLGREISEQRNYGEEVARLIDQEVRRFIDEAYNRATEVLIKYRDKLGELAAKLIEKETLDRKEFEAIFA